jgi:hypothetical protein
LVGAAGDDLDLVAVMHQVQSVEECVAPSALIVGEDQKEELAAHPAIPSTRVGSTADRAPARRRDTDLLGTAKRPWLLPSVLRATRRNAAGVGGAVVPARAAGPASVARRNAADSSRAANFTSATCPGTALTIRFASVVPAGRGLIQVEPTWLASGSTNSGHARQAGDVRG